MNGKAHSRYDWESLESAVHQLPDELNLPLFQDLPKFKALGDDDGLFIMVKQERTWYPTEKRAIPFPMTVTIEGEHEKETVLDNYPYTIKVSRKASLLP